jgi:hypothetical protein
VSGPFGPRFEQRKYFTARKGRISSGDSKRRTLAGEQRVELCDRTSPGGGCGLTAGVPWSRMLEGREALRERCRAAMGETTVSG